MTTTRRSFLKQALMTGLASSSYGIPRAISRARAIAPDPGTTWRDAEHVVILMQENRSFDHVFGTLSGVRGYNDPHPLRLSCGHSAFFQPDGKGRYCPPWRLNIHDTKVTWMGSIPHDRTSQVDAWNGGWYDQWLKAKRPPHTGWQDIPLTMGHYTRADLPFYYALADAFTVCDQNYCGVMAGTSPNRLMFWSGTVREGQRRTDRAYMRNEEIDYNSLDWTTFPQRLQQAGISWGFYQNELSTTAGLSAEEDAWLTNFGCNVLEYFKAFHVSARPDFSQWLTTRLEECQNWLKEWENKAKPLSEAEIAARQEVRAFMAHLEKRRGTERSFAALSEEEKALFSRAFITNAQDPDYRKLERISFSSGGKRQEMKAPRGDILHQFRQDARQGKLPAISWLAAPERFSDHPVSAWFGTWYVSEILNILTENPELWKKTIFIMTYDENDGYFDHCPSYAAPDPNRPETGASSVSIGPDGLEYTNAQDEIAQGVPEHLARSGPIGLGFRVPMVIASPWSRGGWVNSELYDHSSSLQFLERFIEEKYGRSVREDNISSWRRAICGDLTSCFHDEAEPAPALPYMDRNQHLQSIEQAAYRPLPGGYQFLSEAAMKVGKSKDSSRFLPGQEPGMRPSCALSYTLHCDGGLVQDGRTLGLSLQADRQLFGARTAGAPFLVCSYDQGQMVSSGTYAVAAGDRMDLPLALPLGHGPYEVAVHAPNGFYRLFQGHRDGPALGLFCQYEVGPSTIHLQLTLQNKSGQNLHVLLEENRAGAELAGRSGAKKGGVQKQRHLLVLPAGGQKILSLDLTQQWGWYDIGLTVREDPSFRRHLAGRIESGRPSMSDPLMAG